MRWLFALVAVGCLSVLGCQIEKSTPSPRGSLYVTTSDSSGAPVVGARIYLNDVPQSQTTPALIGPLAAGNYRMTVQLRSFIVDTEAVSISAGDTTHSTVSLQLARTGYITATSTPDGAVILLNEEYLTDNHGNIQTTPATFSASVGQQNISVALTGYKTVTPSLQRINLTPGDTIPISFGLDQATIGKLVGNVIPYFAERLAGQDSTVLDTLRLDQYRGHLTLITCWFTSCVPCRAELPFFDLLYREYASQGVRFVALTTLQPSQQPYIQVLQAVQQVGISFPVTLDTQPNFWETMVPSVFNGYPLNILVDSTGTIVSSQGSITEDQLRNLITSHLP